MAVLNPTMAEPVQSGDFEQCPEGHYQAVLCDVVDMGWLPNNFGDGDPFRPTIKFVYQVNHDQSDGKPFLIFGRLLALPKTLESEKSALRKEIIQLVGLARFNEIIALIKSGQFDMDSLIGTNCRIGVVHKASKSTGKVYANIDGMFPWGANDGEQMIVRDYTRRCERNDVQMPYPSAFEARARAFEMLGVAPGVQMPPKTAAPAAGGTPAPQAPPPAPQAAAPAAPPVAPPVATPPATPPAAPPAPSGAPAASSAQIDELMTLAVNTLGAAPGMKKLEELSKEVGVDNFRNLTENQTMIVAAALKKAVWSAEAAKERSAQAGAAIDEDLGEDPFADE